jgi:hypothetical protein
MSLRLTRTENPAARRKSGPGCEDGHDQPDDRITAEAGGRRHPAAAVDSYEEGAPVVLVDTPHRRGGNPLMGQAPGLA